MSYNSQSACLSTWLMGNASSLLPSTRRNTFLFNFSRKDGVWITTFNFREEEREDYLEVRKS